MSVKLYSASVCPFAHRTRLTLHEKGVNFELIAIDLSNKPSWFSNVVLEHYRDISLPKNCYSLQKWWQQMSQRDSVQKIQNASEFYIVEYEKYANNTVNSLTAQEMRDN